MEENYYCITNSDNKKWSIPTQNTRMGFEIYEPSSWKGKLIKRCCYLLKFKLVRCFCNITIAKVELPDDLVCVIKKIFGANAEYSIFWGTPSTDQKITIQIFNNTRIYGYCKYGFTNRVKELFDREVQYLEYLKSKNINHIPAVLYNDINENRGVFIQSTEKINGRTKSEFGEQHLLFLNTLFAATHEVKRFEKTDLYTRIIELKKGMELIPSIDKNFLQGIIEKVILYYKNQVVDWGAVHGDFTPWNTCLANNTLFVFDFEYALYNGPSAIDKWHFILQKLYYERKYSTHQIFQHLKAKHRISFGDTQELYEFMLYFLFFISIYVQRGSEQDIYIASQRAKLLQLCLQDIG